MRDPKSISEGTPHPATPNVDLLCILALALEWIFFGSCHFTFREETEAQIPGFLDSFKTFIAAITGMIEIPIGILILFPRTRKWAAIASFVLLCLFLPSIYHMLVNDEAIRG